MSRQPRQISAAGIYHVVLRSVNQQIIFEEPEDFISFLRTLRVCKDRSGCKYLAYCLMENHIHMLLETCNESVSTVIQRITNSFVMKYNEKYDRSGHLFQGRFFSEPVNTDAYLMNAFRYILQNPVRAGIVKKPEEYLWSSCGAYFKVSDDITDCNRIITYFNSFNELYDFVNTVLFAGEFRAFTGRKHLTDREALFEMENISGCNNPSEFQQLPRAVRDDNLKKLRGRGLSIRQISRITGISKSTVERAGQKNEDKVTGTNVPK